MNKNPYLVFHRAAGRLVAVAILSFTLGGTALADLILSAPPRENATQGQRTYGPLAKHLSSLLGQKVVYQHPKNWQQYKTRTQKDEYDIVFDGPQFAAWRIANLSATPVAKLPGALQFVVVVRRDDNSIKKVMDLVGVKTCTLPSPNLGGLTLYSMFPNPVRQPALVQIHGGLGDVAKALVAGKCRAAILPKAFYLHKVPQSARQSMKIIKESARLTNQGITVSTRVSAADQKKMLKFLTTRAGTKALRPILDRFGKKSNKLVAAGTADYKGANLLHDNMIFGW